MRSNGLNRILGILLVLIFMALVIWYSSQKTLSPKPITTSLGAIRAVQSRYHEVSNFDVILTPVPFRGQLIIVNEKQDGWDIIFYQGAGDCAAGCIDSYYWYFSVYTHGEIIKMGEFSRVFEPKNNSFKEVGLPMWGYPR